MATRSTAASKTVQIPVTEHDGYSLAFAYNAPPRVDLSDYFKEMVLDVKAPIYAFLPGMTYIIYDGREIPEPQVVGQFNRLVFPTRLPDTYTLVTFDLDDPESTPVESSERKMSEKTRARLMRELQVCRDDMHRAMTPMETLDVSQQDF